MCSSVLCIKEPCTPDRPFLSAYSGRSLGTNGHQASIFRQPWPEWDDEYTKAMQIELVVQVNGKVRAKAMVPAGLPDEKLKEIALRDRKVGEFTGDKPVRKVIIVKGKLVNIVV